MSDGINLALVRQVADRQEITTVVHRYCRALDRRDRALLESVFHPDSTHEMGGYVGPSAQFCQFAFDVLSELETTQHFLGNVQIELDGDTAYVESYFQAYHRVAADQAATGSFEAHTPGVDEDVFICGRYIDRFERRGGVWKVAHRTGVQDWCRWEAADARGWPANARGPVGTRDRTDRLYTAGR
ncbi:MAG: nuclear transport factor 2 family protein [Sphingomonadales bacterium]